MHTSTWETQTVEQMPSIRLIDPGDSATLRAGLPGVIGWSVHYRYADGCLNPKWSHSCPKKS